MISRVLVASSLALLAVATPWDVPTTTATVTVTAPAPTVTTANQCNTGSIQCCQSTMTGNSLQGSAILGLLGIVMNDPSALIGQDCSPLSVIGVGSGSCNSSPVCCSDNAVGGLFSVGCVPISL